MKERIALSLYSLAWWWLTPLVVLRLWFKSSKQPNYRRRWAERMGRWPDYPKGCVWVHAVSVGETVAARGLVEQWIKEHPDIPVLITTTTPTGSDTVRQLFKNRVHHAYLPWDIASVQRRLVSRLKPKLMIIMETELWPNLIDACSRQKVPVLIANARLSEKSLAGYERAKSLTLPMLNKLTGIAAQHTPDADRFVSMGLDERKIQVTGSIKFDIEIDSSAIRATRDLAGQIGKRPIWIAASTHAGEDEIILSAHAKLKSKVPDALLILVPRHPERADRIGGMLYKRHFHFARRSLQQIPTPNESVFLIDTLGELMTFYGLAQAAFIGNTLNHGGGHNPIEAAALAKPVLIGPSYTNFQTILDAMKYEQAVVMVQDDNELKNRLVGLLQSKDLRDTYGQRAYLFYQQQQGALRRLMTWIEDIVDLQSPKANSLMIQKRKTVNENDATD